MSGSRKVAVLLTLILAGEGVFFLPFVVSRIFRPTFLKVFGLTNFELGSAFAAYGLVAMICYFAGGPLADRFSARKLMAIALFSTSLGGIFLATIPDLFGLTITYAFWGVTSILLFWAALIKATREWGGGDDQGKAYGLLDGGRGLFVAIISSLMVYLFSSFLPLNVRNSTPEELRSAMQVVILTFSTLTFLIGIVVWWVIPESSSNHKLERLEWQKVVILMKKSELWMLSIIVICAYMGYKTTDDFSLYVSDAFDYDDVSAASVGTLSFWIRPIAAIPIGFLADRFKASRMILICFLIMVIGSAIISSGVLTASLPVLIMLSIAMLSAGIYGLRGIYFALMQEVKIPLVLTGTAVGIVSLVGYTPDVFAGPLMGYLIDNSPGASGHQQVFMVLGIFGVVGMLMSFLLMKKSQKVRNSV